MSEGEEITILLVISHSELSALFSHNQANVNELMSGKQSKCKQ